MVVGKGEMTQLKWLRIAQRSSTMPLKPNCHRREVGLICLHGKVKGCAGLPGSKVHQRSIYLVQINPAPVDAGIASEGIAIQEST